jgi:hypothetical protein
MDKALPFGPSSAGLAGVSRARSRAKHAPFKGQHSSQQNHNRIPFAGYARVPGSEEAQPPRCALQHVALRYSIVYGLATCHTVTVTGHRLESAAQIICVKANSNRWKASGSLSPPSHARGACICCVVPVLCARACSWGPCPTPGQRVALRHRSRAYLQSVTNEHECA